MGDFRDLKTKHRLVSGLFEAFCLKTKIVLFWGFIFTSGLKKILIIRSTNGLQKILLDLFLCSEVDSLTVKVQLVVTRRKTNTFGLRCYVSSIKNLIFLGANVMIGKESYLSDFLNHSPSKNIHSQDLLLVNTYDFLENTYSRDVVSCCFISSFISQWLKCKL